MKSSMSAESSTRGNLINRLQTVQNAMTQPRDVQISFSRMRGLMGCRMEEHLTIGEDGSLRIASSGHAPIQAAEDPLTMIQEGLPVLYWDGGTFGHRVLKVDDLLVFLYLIVDESFGGKINSAVTKQEVMAVRLNRISRIFVGGEGLRICDMLEIQDHHLTAESVLVLQTGQVAPNEAPKIEQVVVLMLSPTSVVRKCLEHTLRKAPEHDPLTCESKIAKRGDSRKNAGNDLGDGSGHPKLLQRVIKARIKDSDGVFNKNAKALDVEITMRPEGRKSSGGMDLNLSCSMPLDIDPATMEPEVLKLEQKLGQSFVPVDEVRVHLTLCEAVTLRHWSARLSTAEGFNSGISNFVNDQDNLNCVVHQDECFSSVHRAVALPDTSQYGVCEGAVVRSCCRALSMMLNLEQVFAHTMKQGAAGKLFDVPRRVTLAGEVLPDGLDDEEPGAAAPPTGARSGATSNKDTAATEDVKAPLLGLGASPPVTARSAFSVPAPCSARLGYVQVPCMSARDRNESAN